MSKEEMMSRHEVMHKGSEMILEKIEKIGREQDKFSWQELMYMSDILKDMSEVEENLAKACHYSKDVPMV